MAKATETVKQHLFEKIDDMFGFDLTNRDDGVSYDFGQYRLNKLYKPLVKYYIVQFLDHLGEYDDQQVEKILGLFVDFYSLYFSNGDFGYFKNRFSTYEYRIPYSGKDTEFRWATKDCYYVKTSDVVNDMSVSLGGLFDDRKAKIKLFKRTEATQTSDGKEKYDFSVHVEEQHDEEEQLVGYNITFINWEESNENKATKEKRIHEILAEYGVDTKNEPIKSTLDSFLKKWGRDYFIHKRLKAFLHEELEWYFFQMLKTDIQGKANIVGMQAKIEEIKAKYADDAEVVDFKIGQLMKESQVDGTQLGVYETAYLWILNFANILGDLEEFKAKLWNKKRKVIKQEYCISLGKLPESLRDQVVQNESQQKEWKDMGMVANNGRLLDDSSLVVDTRHFIGPIKDKLLQFASQEEAIGELYHSDNYQALRFMKDNYSGKIKCIYIDPPYNTGKDGFVYKDAYQSASWLTMMKDRIIVAKDLLKNEGVVFTSIGDHESSNINKLYVESMYSFIAQNIWLKGKEGGNDNVGMGNHHEYVLMYGKDKSEIAIKLDDKDTSRHISELPEKNLVKGIEEVYLEGELFQLINLSKQKDYKVRIPLKDGSEITRDSYCPQKTIDEYIRIGKLFVGSKGTPYVKSFLKEESAGTKPSTVIEQKYGTTKAGGIEIRNIFGSKPFSYPKPTKLINRLVSIIPGDDNIILDYFAGSGTTGHAVIKLNKVDGGSRKFILVELGEYFDSVTLPRIKKVLYSDNWKNGVAQDNDGTQAVVSYKQLNQYEDWFNEGGYLDNLEDKITKLETKDVTTIDDVKQLLYPLSELKERVYRLDE